MTQPLLQTERLTLRPPLQSDWPAVSAFMERSDRLDFIGGPMADEFTRWRAFLANAGHWALKGFGFFMVLLGDTRVGRVGLIDHVMWEEPELGWHIFDGFEGKGYVTEAALAVRNWAYDTLGLGPLVSNIHPDNLRSIRVAERLGAVMERETTLLGNPCQVWRHPARGQIWRHPGPEVHA